jgi:hypothetical protein
VAYHGSGWESGNKESEERLQREENASYTRGRTANPSIVEMSRNTKVERGGPEQKMTKY